MKSILIVLSGLIMIGCSNIQHSIETPAFDPGLSTLKIQAISASGKQNLGSGVIIAPDKIATNCHVMRNARRAYISHPERLYKVLAQAALPEFDACILQTDGLNLPAAPLAESESVKVGDDIILSGYPFALGLRMMRGKIIHIHAYGDGQIVEINSGFNHGASGGGVFDKTGKLIGLMTFMGQEAGSMHFYVIPANWLAKALEEEFEPLKPLQERSFWEKGDFVKELEK